MPLPATTWIQRFFGLDAGSIPEGADIRLTWTNAPRSWEVFVYVGVVAALLYLVVFLYRREIDTCPPRIKRLLTGLRVAVLLLLATVYLAPAITYTARRVLHPVVVLLRDGSRSMNIADGKGAGVSEPSAPADPRSSPPAPSSLPTRAQRLDARLEEDDRALLGALERRGKLRVADFSDRVVQVETRPARANDEARMTNDEDALRHPPAGLPELQAAGPATDLHGAIADGLSDRLTAAVVIFTDGQHTGPDTDKADLLALAEKARRQGVPLMFVGVGDPNRPRNLQVTEVHADAQVWKDDPFEIRAVLRAVGIARPGGEPRTVQVKLIERKTPDDANESPTEQVIQRREVALPGEDGPVRLVFTHTPKTPGRFAYTVAVEPVEGEITEDDNTPPAPAEVKVLGEQARMLLVAGAATWEYRQVQQLFQRNKTIDLSCWLQTLDEDRAQEGNTTIKQLPVTAEQLAEYDVILLFDPDPVEFDEPWIALLKEFIGEHAGGMLYMAGPMFANRFLSQQRTAAIQDALPVRMGDIGAMEVATLLGSHARAWPLDVVEAAVDEPIMRFYPETAATLECWKRFPGIYWSFPAKEAKPASRVLIEHSDPTLRQVEASRPLLVTGQYGSGRTVYMGFNGTWRWRKLGSNAEFFNRFWLQTARYLVEGRSMQSKRRGTIETDRLRYEVGQRVVVSARLSDATLRPLEQPEVKATLEVAGDAALPVTLRQIANQPGRYEATVTAEKTGRHVLAVDLSDESATSSAIDTPTIETTFSVFAPNVESFRTWLDKPLLVELAEASGGRYFDVDRLDDLPAAVPDRSRPLEVLSKPIPLWDTNRVLLLLAALLTVEWILRKRFRLL